MAGILIALVAAVAYSLGGVMQHRAISRKTHDAFDAGSLGSAARQPMWIIGLIVMALGVGIQLVALAIMPLVVVQTIMVSMIFWILVFAVILEKARLGRREYIGAAVLAVAVLLFVVVVQPSIGTTAVNFGGWALMSLLVVVCATVLMLVSRRLPAGPAAALLGTAAGLINVQGAGLASASLNLLSTGGIGGLFTSWLPYVAAAMIVISIGVTAMAFAAGPVTASIPPMIAANPVFGFVLGVVLLGEVWSTNALGYALGTVALVVMIAGIVVLSKSQVVAEQFAGTPDVELGKELLAAADGDSATPPGPAGPIETG